MESGSFEQARVLRWQHPDLPHADAGNTCPRLLDILFLTAVFGVETLALLDLMVAYRHPVPQRPQITSPAASWSFPSRAVATVFSMRLRLARSWVRWLRILPTQ